MWTAILQALGAYVRRAGDRKPVDAVEPSPAPTLAAPSPGAVSDHPGEVLSAAADFAAPFEGFRPRPYLDAAGVWTIGYGSTHDADGKPVTAGTAPITEPEARHWMARDMRSCADTLQADCKVTLTRNEQIALDDFIYNVGAGNFATSTLLKKLNAGDHAGAAAEFVKWDHAGGKVLAGLLKRRQAEEKLFETA